MLNWPTAPLSGVANRYFTKAGELVLSPVEQAELSQQQAQQTQLEAAQAQQQAQQAECTVGRAVKSIGD
jgi:hypothetical protein